MPLGFICGEKMRLIKQYYDKKEKIFKSKIECEKCKTKFNLWDFKPLQYKDNSIIPLYCTQCEEETER